MNSEQQELLDEAYMNYSKNQFKEWEHGMEYESRESFARKCKTDSEFSERWGLNIEERELSLEERCDEYIKRHPKETNDGVLNYKWIGDNLCTHEDYDKWNIPTKLITVTYRNQKIESYE
jgi:hypothetical protein